MFKCIFGHKYNLVNIFYEEFTPSISNYGVRTIEYYRCSNCDKEKYIVIDECKNVYSVLHLQKIKTLKEKGIKDIVDFKIGNINI